MHRIAAMCASCTREMVSYIRAYATHVSAIFDQDSGPQIHGILYGFFSFVFVLCVDLLCSNPFELNRTFEDIVLNLAATREMTMNFVAVVLLRFDCDSLSKWHTIKRLKFFCESFSKFVSLHNNQAVHWVENAKCQYIDWRDDAFSERAVIFDISLVQTSYWCVYAYLNLRSPTKWTFF